LASRYGSIYEIYCQADAVSQVKPSLSQSYSQHMYLLSVVAAAATAVVMEGSNGGVSEVIVVSVRKETDHEVETVDHARKGIGHRVHRESDRDRVKVRDAHRATDHLGQVRVRVVLGHHAHKETDHHVRVESSSLWQGQSKRIKACLRHRMQLSRRLRRPQHPQHHRLRRIQMLERPRPIRASRGELSHVIGTVTYKVSPTTSRAYEGQCPEGQYACIR
jgi:hypothetical protein